MKWRKTPRVEKYSKKAFISCHIVANKSAHPCKEFVTGDTDDKITGIRVRELLQAILASEVTLL